MLTLLLPWLLWTGCAGLLALRLWRAADHRADRRASAHLVRYQPAAPKLFDAACLAELPEPVQRYFRFAILPGTPVRTVAHITMQGQFGAGNQAKPRYMRMQAQQTLAAPHGFVWSMRARKGLMQLSGSDSERWTRFWLHNLIPVARLGGEADHRRAAFGRLIGEAAFWTPAALLPGPGIHWRSLDAHTIEVAVQQEGLTHTLTLDIDDQGQPWQIRFQRWSNANATGTWQWQPFGGTLSNYQTFDGFRLPTHIEAGNLFGTDAYFPFFIVDVQHITFPQPLTQETH